jgi:hypothetical protein
MLRFLRAIVPVLAVGMFLVIGSHAHAQCKKIGGKGTGGSVESAKFQAYEAMLQGTDLGMWATWMVSGAKVGDAPGYSVRGLFFRCKPGGMGAECLSQATFCKRT